jgi:plastocyanin
VVIAADINAFHVFGAILAVWAVALTAVGVMSHDFPPKGLEKVVIAISAILVVAAISSAIITSGEEKPKGSEIASHRNKSGEEGSTAPDQGGKKAPGTGSNSGQTPSGETGKKPPAGQVAQTLTNNIAPGTSFAFEKSSLTAKPGPVRLVATNPQAVPHNISLQGPGGLDLHGKTVPKGGSSQVSTKLKPGKYTFYCSVPGHRQAGMEGTLTVK